MGLEEEQRRQRYAIYIAGHSWKLMRPRGIVVGEAVPLAPQQMPFGPDSIKVLNEPHPGAMVVGGSDAAPTLTATAAGKYLVRLSYADANLAVLRLLAYERACFDRVPSPPNRPFSEKKRMEMINAVVASGSVPHFVGTAKTLYRVDWPKFGGANNGVKQPLPKPEQEPAPDVLAW